MNQIATQQSTSINEIGVITGNGSKIAPQTLGEVVRFAEVMCKADIALPKHLRGNAGACMAVALQALEWEMSPFAVASKSYQVNGHIAYEAQLIAAVVNTRSGIKGRLKYQYSGEGENLTCRVVGILDGEECEYETPPMGSITPKNSPLWKSDPRQQLGYYAARSWARRHCPEVLLGVYDRDEAAQFQGPDNAKDVTPSVMARFQAAKAQEPAEKREGFDMDHITRETGTLASEDAEQVSSASPSLADEGDGAAPAPETPSTVATNSEPAEAADQAEEASTEQASTPEASHGDEAGASSAVNPQTYAAMTECIDRLLGAATDTSGGDVEKRKEKVEKFAAAWCNELPDHTAFVDKCKDTALRIAEKPAERAKAEEYLKAKLPEVKA